MGEGWFPRKFDQITDALRGLAPKVSSPDWGGLPRPIPKIDFQRPLRWLDNKYDLKPNVFRNLYPGFLDHFTDNWNTEIRVENPFKGVDWYDHISRIALPNEWKLFYGDFDKYPAPIVTGKQITKYIRF